MKHSKLKYATLTRALRIRQDNDRGSALAVSCPYTVELSSMLRQAMISYSTGGKRTIGVNKLKQDYMSGYVSFRF